MKSKRKILVAAAISAILALGGLALGEAASRRPLAEAPQGFKKISKMRKMRKMRKMSKMRKMGKMGRIVGRKRHRRRSRLG
jgi:hypothetical protein